MAETLRNRLAGKWQIPLFLCSLGLLVTSLLRLRPEPPPPTPLGERLASLQALVEEGLNQRAIGVAKSLLHRDDVNDDHKAFIHLQFARARFAEALRLDKRKPEVGRAIIESFEQANAIPGNLEAVDCERWGQALEWQDEIVPAVEQYEVALSKGVDSAARLLRHVIELRERRLAAKSEEIDHELDRLLTEIKDSDLEMLLWALERKLDLLEELNRLPEGDSLLALHRHKFNDSPLRNRVDFLQGWLYYRTGRLDEAETHLRAVQRQIKNDDETYARVGWLLGRVALSHSPLPMPNEALSFFDDAILHYFSGPYSVAIRLGRAEALAMLDRHVDAIEAFRGVASAVVTMPPGGPVDRDVVRGSLSVQSESSRQKGELLPALEYARLATSLVNKEDVTQSIVFLTQLAQTQTMLAEKLEKDALTSNEDDEETKQLKLAEARAMFGDAAVTFGQLAVVATLDDRQAGDASWLSAELFGRAGQHENAANGYMAYVLARPADSLTPRAFLRMGQSYQAMGVPSKAITAFEECFRRFPRSVDGMGSLVPLAESYLSLGPSHEDDAIRALKIILDDSEVFTPKAPAFADALFLLGEVQNRRGEFDASIETLEEAVARYPDDARVSRSLYFLGDSYRRSARAIKDQWKDARSTAQGDDLRDRYSSRMRKAQEYFRKIVQNYEKDENVHLPQLDEMYIRHAYLYQADCAFDVGEHRLALKLYEDAAGRFQRQAAGLSAHVQIINCYTFLGESAEAKSALARALVLVDALPSEAFHSDGLMESRDEWRKYFKWVEEANLF